jgi:hypothetical protein
VRLLQVGTPGGICSGLPDVPDRSGLVRLGRELLCVDEGLYRIWRACGAAPGRDELVEWAGGEGMPDAAGDVQSLLEMGLLATEGSPGLDSLAIQMTGECLGNGEDGGRAFRLLGRDGALAEVDPCTFEALLNCDGATPIAALCDRLEGSQPGPAADVYLRALLAALPILVAAGAVRLDRGLRP